MGIFEPALLPEPGDAQPPSDGCDGGLEVLMPVFRIIRGMRKLCRTVNQPVGDDYVMQSVYIHVYVEKYFP